MKGSLRQQMMRCYILGYITTRHNDRNIVSQSEEYNSYKDLKIVSAREKLIEYGMNRQLAFWVVRIAPHFELLISLAACFYAFLCASFSFLKAKRLSYHNMRFCPKLNVSEKRVLNLFGKAGLGSKDFVAIDIPGQYTKYSEIKTVSVFSNISYKQLFLSFYYSILLTWFMIHKYRHEDMLFRSYASFPFFLCFFFIDNLDDSNELCFYNHYDRWMYLLGNSRLKRTYVQHGKLWRDHIKRINCDVAYYLNNSQQEVLEYTLFNNPPEARYQKVFEYSGMEKMKNNGRKDVLIICISIFASKHEHVLGQLSDKQVNIYVKPHPQDNPDVYNKLKDRYPDIVILGKYDYPKVDYVISYESTLADEYEMHDLPVIRYSDKNYEEIFRKWFDNNLH